jgi:4-aminobutyrate aminotransferase-like enzyme
MINNEPEKEAMEKGHYLMTLLKEKLDDIPSVGNIRGRGLLMGVELVQDRKTKQPATELVKRVVKQLRPRGILTVTSGYYGNVIKISPPVAIEKEQMDFFVDVLVEELNKGID